MPVDLFAIPYAGAGGTVYRPWTRHLRPAVRLHPVTLPGRGARAAEPPARHVAAAVDAVVAQIRQTLAEGGPDDGDGYAVFGHSMGALVAYETVRRLGASDAELPRPRLLVVSGLDAPDHLPARRPPRHELPDSGLLDLLRDYGGTAPELLDEEVFGLFLPPLRADLRVLDTYRWAPGPPLPVPLVCYRGVDDAGMSDTGTAAWERLVTGPFATRAFAGGHFWLHEPLTVCGALLEDLPAESERSTAAGL